MKSIQQIIFAFIFGLTLTSNIFSNGIEKFEIVYNASLESVNDTEWLSKIKNEWHATGINLRILWSQTEIENGVFDWKLLDGSLDNLMKEDLDVYVRIVMGTNIPWWLIQSVGCDNRVKSKYLTEDDVHKRSGGGYFYNHYYRKMVLNLTGNSNPNGLNSVFFMNRFYSETIERIKNWGVKNSYADKIKLIVPVLSPDEESEFPSALYNCETERTEYELSGYSAPEINSFRNFLREKYEHDIDALNENWGSSFSAFEEIDPVDMNQFDWSKSKYTYKYHQGRIDFIDFRTQLLKRFFDRLAEITHEHDLKFGLQFGSIYDEAIYRRGFIDPTPLLEHADHFIIGDVFEYSPNIEFASNYARSIASFWKNYRGRSIRFSTESNWPGYRGIKDEDLVEFWEQQAVEYYRNGGSALFISHWDTGELAESAGESVKSGSLSEAYSMNWARTLQKLKDSDLVINEPNKNAVNLSCEQIFYYNDSKEMKYFHNRGSNVGRVKTNAGVLEMIEFPIVRFTKPAFNPMPGSASYKLNDSDIITNYMLSEYPQILNKYKTFHLTASSNYMPLDIYNSIVNADNKPRIIRSGKIKAEFKTD